jgi:NADP-dependent 3-hydroxy acid dehydrogenase YdfG
MHQVTEDELDVCYNVNVKGTFWGAQEAVKQFFEQWYLPYLLYDFSDQSILR